jgi:hypothetical protein
VAYVDSCCIIGAAILLQAAGEQSAPIAGRKKNGIIFRALGSGDVHTPLTFLCCTSAALQLQQMLQHSRRKTKKGAPLARGALPET